MKLKSFMQFINEGEFNNLTFIKNIANRLIDNIKSTNLGQESGYSSFSGISFTSPFKFDLYINVRKDKSPDLSSDEYFNHLSWEIENFKSYGYCIDANTHISNSKEVNSKIIINLILDPSKEPHLYTSLYYRLLDILTHETNHLDQASKYKTPFNIKPESKSKREYAKNDYHYFLLSDEIESMIEGMYVKSKESGEYLDIVFELYLKPFIKQEYITQYEFNKVIVSWIKRSLALYPDAKFSPKCNGLINSL